VRILQYFSLFFYFHRLAEKHGLKKVDRQTFHDYFNCNKNTKEGRFLLSKMKALEVKETINENFLLRETNNLVLSTSNRESRSSTRIINRS
jgi:hypothetical protein